MFRNPLTDVIVVFVIILLVMGPKRLPGLGRGLGQGLREFKDGITGQSQDDGTSSLTSTQAKQASADRPAQNAAAPGPKAGEPGA